jgi:hypothetical protein
MVGKISYLGSKLQGLPHVPSGTNDRASHLDISANTSKGICNAWDVVCWSCVKMVSRGMPQEEETVAVLTETNAHHNTTCPQHSCAVLVCCAVRSGDNEAMRAQAIGDFPHFSWDIRYFHEVNKVIGADLLAHGLLVLATINGNDSHTHGFGILNTCRTSDTILEHQ